MILILLAAVLLCACAVDENQRIDLTDDLERIGGALDLSTGLDEQFIIHYVNFDCSICFLEFEDWFSFLENLDKPKRKVLFIVYGEDKMLVEYSVLEQLKTTYSIYFDRDRNFFKQNKLGPDKAYQSFLINQSGEIIIKGNPLKLPTLKQKYIKALSE